jgi:hypothetical protein
MNFGEDEDEGMGTSGEIRRQEAEELAHQQREERERLIEAQREREEAERQRRERENE